MYVVSLVLAARFGAADAVRRRFREASVSGRSKLREVLDALSTPNDSPRIPTDDALLGSLRKEHGEGRPDLVIPPPQPRR